MSQKKELDSEVNMISFISLLSVLICALLLSAVWVQLGTMDVKQAVGGQSQAETKKVPAVWVTMHNKGVLRFQLQDAPRKVSRRMRVKSIKGLVDGKIDLDAVSTYVETLIKAIPSLRTVLIKPRGESDYGDIISLMDNFKEAGLIDLGVSPL